MEYDANRLSLTARMLMEYPYLSSPLSVIDAALDLAEFNRDEVFADLGCGDGAVLIRAAKRFGILSIGFELDPYLVKLARRNVKDAGLASLVDIVHSDLFTVDISTFNVVYIYPWPPIVEKLSEKIVNECARGSRILVHDYPLLHIHPIKIIRIPGGDFHTHKIYLFKL